HQLVTLFDQNDRPLGSVTANAAGTWTLEITQDLVIGNNIVTAKTSLSQSAGFELTYQLWNAPALTIDPEFFDNVGITGFINAAQETTDDTRPRFSGKAAPQQVIRLYDQDGNLLATTYSNVAGRWQVEISRELQEGVNQVYATSNGETSAPLQVTVNTNIPTPLTIDRTAYDNVGFESAYTSGLMMPTDDNRPTFSGTALAGESVSLYDAKNRLLAVTVADEKGRWEVELQNPLENGVNRITAKTTNEVSNDFILNVRATNMSRQLNMDSLLSNAEENIISTAGDNELSTSSYILIAEEWHTNLNDGGAMPLAMPEFTTYFEEDKNTVIY
ncbi:Ig-like domain-containing protein, partial [Pantoea trifolii]|uniref:Ig-like domain-containing protein n=1 Tax=Candidatus Pantoea symbiotica TaxID=1884370 RepID=UPI0024137BD4